MCYSAHEWAWMPLPGWLKNPSAGSLIQVLNLLWGTFCHSLIKQESKGNTDEFKAGLLHRVVLLCFVWFGLLWSCFRTHEVLQPEGPFQTWFPLGMTQYLPIKCDICKFLSGEQQLLWITNYLNKPVLGSQFCVVLQPFIEICYSHIWWHYISLPSIWLQRNTFSTL